MKIMSCHHAGRSGSVHGMEENLKRALTEMLFLLLLSEKEMHVPEIAGELFRRSKGAIKLVFPYSGVKRLAKFGYLQAAERKVAPDGRRRQYFEITEAGRRHLVELVQLYEDFSLGVQNVFTAGEQKAHEKC